MNGGTVAQPVSPPTVKKRVSEEQRAIMLAARNRKSFKVPAFAGTGKTATLRLIALAIAPAPMLIIAYGHNMAEELRTRLRDLRHVTVRTGHALAYHDLNAGQTYGERLESSTFALRNAIETRYRAQLMRLSSQPRDAADLVLSTIQAYQNSASFEIGIEHVPEVRIVASPQAIALLAREVFQQMTSPDGDLPLSHDSYFKYWQAVVRPRLDAHYQLIGFDEGQDGNPVMLAVFQDQACAKIIVGDTHQSLFGFRDAVNAMESLPWDELPLTQSWRFGPAIAALANRVLALKGERRQLRGSPTVDTQVVVTPAEPVVPTFILARTNAGVFEAALAQVQAGRTISIARGVGELTGMILGAYELWVHGRSTHPAFRFFRNWATFIEATKGPRGAEYAPFARIVEAHKETIPDKCAAIANAVGGDGAVLVSTVHTAKGLQGDVVQFADDFSPFMAYDPKAQRIVFRPEEANVHYVALTRPMRLLILGEQFAQVHSSSLALMAKTRGYPPPGRIEDVVAEARSRALASERVGSAL